VYERIDLSLDAFPWSGHTTSCESLWMGVPMLTLSGNRHAGRMVASVLTHLGLGEFVATNRQEFLASAVKLSKDQERLAALRSKMRELMRVSPLCDGKAFTKGLEEAYRRMWHTWCASGK